MNFLFTINDNYAESIKVLLFSIYSNMGGNHKFYFIYQSISLENRNGIIKYAEEECNSSAFFIEYYNNKLDELTTSKAWSIEIYFRLFSPYKLPDVDKILYLDGDTIVNGDLTELFLMDDFDKYALAAVANDEQNSHKCRLCMDAQDTYVNSGVMLMNLEKMRGMFLEEEITVSLLNLKEKLLFPDQDFINIIFKDNIKLLDIKYNYMINLTERVENYPKLKKFKICHYVLCNPWEVWFPYKTDKLYFKYLLKSKEYKKVIYLLYKHRKVRLKNKLSKFIKG